MSLDVLQIQQFMDFFSGSNTNYGQYLYSGEKKNSKVQGKPSTIVNKVLTIEEYRAHLDGRKGLGVIPINAQGKVKFSVIDVDVYSVDYTVYIQAIERNLFPVVPFYSKSGGLHLYVFYKEPVKAKTAIDFMRAISFYLSIDLLVLSEKKGSVEVFPKQVRLEKDKVGNWINLPYYNHENTRQFSVYKNQALSLPEALLRIKALQITEEGMRSFLESIPYGDAPPCIQLGFLQGVSESRNNFLFCFGVYLKKKDEDYFEQNLFEINSYLSSPLPEPELEETVLKSLRKKDYTYRCLESPCVDFCYKKICSAREFGIGKNEGYFSSIETGKLRQYKTFEPYYEWEVRLQGQEEFKTLRFKSEEDIIKQDSFLKLCMRELYELPSKLKLSEWFKKVNEALKSIEVISIDMDDDTSPYVLLKNLFQTFLTERVLAEKKEQIQMKRVFFSLEKKAYFFRVKDLIDFLYVQKNFRYFSPSELHGVLREFGAVNTVIKTESGKSLRVSSIPEQKLEHPNMIEKFKPDFSEYKDNTSDF